MDTKTRKLTGLMIDLLLYLILFAQMGYVLTGNALHEWLGVLFLPLLCGHLWLKRKWFTRFFRRKGKLFSSRRFADLVILVLLVILAVLGFSSLGVSRLLFSNLGIAGNAELHRWLGTLALAAAMVHGGMHGYFPAKNKKRAAIRIALFTAAAFAVGAWLVPYMNRHLRKVEISYSECVTGEALVPFDDRILTVYFTRVGNTDFAPDVDAVSGASLLLADGSLMGNTELMAGMLHDLIGCDTAAITLTGDKYPSAYYDTVSVAGKELKQQTRPEIVPIDIESYDTILLLYPIWWGTIPMPAASFLENADFSGKTIYLIATQGSSGFAESNADVKALVPEATVKEGISVYCDDIPQARSMLSAWLLQSGLANIGK